MQIGSDSARVRFPPPLAFIGTLLIGLALNRAMGAPRVPVLSGSVQNLIAWLAIVFGGGTILSALSLFRRLGTRAEPWRASSVLVTEGVFRWTRNPMYLGMAAVYAGIALLFDSLTTLLLLAPLIFFIQREVIEREEAYLESRFGQRYLAYKASVRRWI